jgi:hypothetical protein
VSIITTDYEKEFMPNKLFYTEVIMGGVTEYGVTLLAGECSDYRAFASADEVNRCILDLKYIKEMSTLCALEEFILYTVDGRRSCPSGPPGLRPNVDGLVRYTVAAM